MPAFSSSADSLTTAGDLVGAIGAHDITPGAACDPVPCAVDGDDQIASATSVEDIFAQASVDGVGAGSAFQHVATFAALERVVALFAVEAVIAAESANAIVSAPAENPVSARAAVELVCTVWGAKTRSCLQIGLFRTSIRILAPHTASVACPRGRPS
jgi:hypothetical protein